jgi:hypothetical protein
MQCLSEQRDEARLLPAVACALRVVQRPLERRRAVAPASGDRVTFAHESPRPGEAVVVAELAQHVEGALGHRDEICSRTRHRCVELELDLRARALPEVAVLPRVE